MNKLTKIVNNTSDVLTALTELFDHPFSCEEFAAAYNSSSPDSAATERIKEAQRTLSIDLHHSLPVYALVSGGWLPPPFVNPPGFLLDRNVIRYIVQIAKGNLKESKYSDTKWWLELFTDEKTYISPFLYAFESGSQMIPDLDEFKFSYEEGVEIIRQFLPRVQIPEFNDEQYDAAIQTMEDVLKFHKQETQFLLRVAPSIRFYRVSEKHLERIREEIIKTALDLGLPLTSLPLLATISCLYEDHDISGFNVGRTLIKPHRLHTDEIAYNVLSDLRGLLFYFAFRGLAETRMIPQLSYVTADRAALLFGCGLNVTKTEWIDNKLNLKMELTKFLFPRMPDEKRQELAQRIQNG